MSAIVQYCPQYLINCLLSLEKQPFSHLSLSTNVKYSCLLCLDVHVILRTRSVPNHYF
nr:MAG TPA: hypothetical protein [Caudoviricetes sp.]DAQ47214.1 MAG TPA: hypothetical protein [Caudoviricetes sp.]